MIQIFTDTSANLPAEVIEEYGFVVVPFTYTIGDEVCVETKDFDGKKFYGAMSEGTRVRTSMVNAFTYSEAFEEAAKKGDDVLYIGMSGGISGSFMESMIAINDLRERYPRRRFAAVNTLTASLGEGIQVVHAAELLKQGASFDEIFIEAERFNKVMCSYFTVDDLSYLQQTGRISRFSAKMGTVLQIKPILTNNEGGQIILHHKVRSRKKALLALAEHYKTLVSDVAATVGIAHADSPEDAAFLEKCLRDAGFSGKMMNVCYEPVTGSHVGPGAVALFFEGKEE